MSECVKEEVAWEPDYVDALALWALYGDHVVKPDLVLGPETIQARHIALPVARGCTTYNNVQPKNEAAPDIDNVSPTHFNLENAVDNMPKTETSQNSEDIITNLEDTTVSTKATQEPGFISTTHKSTPDVIASNIPKKGTMQNLKDISIRPDDTSVSYTLKQGVTQDLLLVSTSHKSIPDIADSNIPNNEARQNFRDISTSLEDPSGSKTSEEEATQHPESIFTSLEDASIRNWPENDATQEPGFICTAHASFPDVNANNVTETEALPNSWDISASLEDASVSNTLKAVEEGEPGDIFNTQTDFQESGARNEPSLHKNVQPSLKPCYVNLERITYKKAFICQICQKVYRYKQNLRIHILSHTKEEMKTIKIANKITKKVKYKYNCHICGKGLPWEQRLIQHMKKHTEDPFSEQVRLKTPKDNVTKTNYTCDICGVSIVRKQNLIKHMKKHAKEKPFVCEVCEKQFSVPWELMDHIKLASCKPLKAALMVDPLTNKILQDLVLKSCYVSIERIKTENVEATAKMTDTDEDVCNGSEDVVYADQQLQSSVRAQVRHRPKNISCDSCSKKFRSHGEMVAHARSHTGEKLFTCDICKKQYYYKQTLQTHIQTIHFGENCHSCKICKEQFRSAFSLRKHVRSQTGEKEKKPYVCKVCKKTFRNERECVDHARVHTGEKPFCCTVCNKGFRLEVALRIHNRIHIGDKPYSCDVCKRTFRFWQRLDAHKRVHTNEKPFICDICKKQFKRFDTLLRHKQLHTGDKPFACEFCDKRFTQKGHLATHRRTHTGEKSFSCTVCDKKFSNAHYLKQHNRIHTGERPHSCNICKKVFAFPTALKVHIRSHTGEKPYDCKVCKKQFTQRSNLRTHMKTHEKKSWPFACHLCEKKYQCRRSLDKHLALHDQYTPYMCDVCGARFKSSDMLSVHESGHYGGELD